MFLLARCKLCKSNPIHLSNMGIQALKSLSKSDKHLKHVKTISSTKPIVFITASSKDSQVASTSLFKNDSISDCTENVSVTFVSARIS